MANTGDSSMHAAIGNTNNNEQLGPEGLPLRNLATDDEIAQHTYGVDAQGNATNGGTTKRERRRMKRHNKKKEKVRQRESEREDEKEDGVGHFFMDPNVSLVSIAVSVQRTIDIRGVITNCVSTKAHVEAENENGNQAQPPAPPAPAVGVAYIGSMQNAIHMLTTLVAAQLQRGGADLVVAS
ncbi:hypothetical protein RND71_018624 [Anisodus tanguticus]|uniref:Uncharacterized protein n=1 Tax=Anisodus tanguticus TaxID=243964 RepID=A0AAE1VB63_9SOLA|nr:hypothetical protein RND71_018624 [Anisodus tanguticus]